MAETTGAKLVRAQDVTALRLVEPSSIGERRGDVLLADGHVVELARLGVASADAQLLGEHELVGQVVEVGVGWDLVAHELETTPTKSAPRRSNVRGRGDEGDRPRSRVRR
jgi:hypothetical protein